MAIERCYIKNGILIPGCMGTAAHNYEDCGSNEEIIETWCTCCVVEPQVEAAQFILSIEGELGANEKQFRAYARDLAARVLGIY